MLNHRGKILKEVVDKFTNQQGMSISALAKKVGYDQSTFYRHIDKDDLGFHIIRKYGRAMKHDFRINFPEMEDEFSMAENDRSSYGMHEQTLSEVVKERDHWREKYYSLLELHNKMLREKLEEAGL